MSPIVGIIVVYSLLILIVYCYLCLQMRVYFHSYDQSGMVTYIIWLVRTHTIGFPHAVSLPSLILLPYTTRDYIMLYA